MTEKRTYAYLMEDVLKNKFDKAFLQEDLWKYVENKKTEEYDIKDVIHWIYYNCWSYEINKIECYYSIYQVLIQKNKFKEDMKRIKKADTSYPLIIIEDKYDKYGSILDGNHRFAKQILSGAKKIKYKYISKKELEKLKITL
jgi:hypothetical protein